jgi:signal transduction histidine kinase
MASGIAHDFNNLLTGILGSASLAALKVPPDSPAAQQLARVLSAAEKATELTSKMLAYAGKGEFALVPSDLNQIVEGVLPLVRTSIGKSTSIQLALAPNLPFIQADRTQIEQVVVNLLTNASEALASEIVVRTGAMAGGEHSPSASVFLEVRDDGSGMDEGTKTRIFDPFFSTKFTGRGLGLSVVSGIVNRHRGKLRVESSPQRGTTFTVLFPAIRSDETDAVERPAGNERLAKLGDR